MKKVVLVTGASRGIGASTAQLAAQMGYAVAINYRSDEMRAEGIAARIRDRGGDAIIVRADVSQEAEVVRLFKSVDEQLGAITALVNNAGVLETQMRVDSIDAARIHRIFATNVVGTMLARAKPSDV